jgi:tetratricopeptide (TPR) repeat protein
MDPSDSSFDPIKLHQQASALHNSGRLKEAEALYQQLLDRFPGNPLSLTGLGTIALQRGELEQGISLLQQSVQIEPNQPLVHSNLGLALRQAGRLDEALGRFDQAIAIAPDFADAYNNRGVALQEVNRLDEALADFDRAIALKPDSAEAHSNRGNILRLLNRLDEALASCDQAITLNPDHAEAHANRGAVLQELKQLDESLASIDRVIALRPDHAEGYANRGAILQKFNRFDEALASCDQAIVLKPEYAEAYSNRGLVFKGLKRPDEALASFDRAIALKPDYAEAHLNRGMLLQELKRFDGALASYEQAIALKPGFAEAHNNRGLALHDLNRPEDALGSYEQAMALKPDYADAYNNRGVVLQELGRLDEALASYEQAIVLQPDFALAYWNKSLLKLLGGDFEAGWKLYEWRWKSGQVGKARNFARPLWLGDRPLSGKILLIHAEQGLGDTIQFCRYVPMAEALGAKVILEVPRQLVFLLSTLKGNIEIVEQGNQLPSFDLHCPVMSLPLAFRTTLANIPASIPYLFADSAKQELWQQRLGKRTRPRVGLVWKSATRKLSLLNRNIPLQILQPLLQLPVEFHMLQKEIEPEETGFLSEFPHLHLHQDGLRDFSDTAALVQEMDLVVSICTSVAHLAGALGKPVWILLPFAADYRWMLDRSDSPWYPTATLFRQPAIGDWSSVIAAVAKQMGSDTRLLE